MFRGTRLVVREPLRQSKANLSRAKDIYFLRNKGKFPGVGTKKLVKCPGVGAKKGNKCPTPGLSRKQILLLFTCATPGIKTANARGEGDGQCWIDWCISCPDPTENCSQALHFSLKLLRQKLNIPRFWSDSTKNTTGLYEKIHHKPYQRNIFHGSCKSLAISL